MQVFYLICHSTCILNITVFIVGNDFVRIRLNNLPNGRNNEILNKHVLRSLQREEDSIRNIFWFQGQS